jgi:HSP20 family protein
MLDTLKQSSRNISNEINRAWESLSEGWRELFTRSRDALTHYAGGDNEELPQRGGLADFPRWSLLAGEVEETSRDILVRVELPGMEKENFHISIEGNVLYLSGEKHFKREAQDSTYHVLERAYGSFQRAIPLPRNVNADKAEANYRNGVLNIRIPKSGDEAGKLIKVS